MNTANLLPIANKNHHESARINPQFVGIGKELVKTHQERKSIQVKEKQASNRVAFLQKQHELAEKKMQKKQSDLERLMQVIARKEAEQAERERLQQEKQENLAQRRAENLRKRHQHQDKLRNAYLSLYGENRDASDSMRRTFNRYQQMRETMREQERRERQSRVINISIQKGQAKRRVDSFHKARNDAFTDRYKRKISEEREVAGNASAKIESLNSLEEQFKMRLQASNSKLHELQQRYTQTYRNRLLTNRSFLSSTNSKSFHLRSHQALEQPPQPTFELAQSLDPEPSPL